MIYNYTDFLKIAKVGMKVRAVPGKCNPCGELYDNGSNVREITGVGNTTFSINRCGHSADDVCFLELVGTDIDSLYVGCVIVSPNKQDFRVLGVCGEVVFLEAADALDTDNTFFYRTIRFFKANGWTVKQSEPVEDVLELTVEEISKKLGKTV